MSLQVRLDLAFRFRHESEADAVAETRGKQSDRERTDMPERIEQAGSSAKFVDASLCPREMIEFFIRRGEKRRAQLRVARSDRLSFVERLRADLADVIDAHQRRRFGALRV